MKKYLLNIFILFIIVSVIIYKPLQYNFSEILNKVMFGDVTYIEIGLSSCIYGQIIFILLLLLGCELPIFGFFSLIKSSKIENNLITSSAKYLLFLVIISFLLTCLGLIIGIQNMLYIPFPWSFSESATKSANLSIHILYILNISKLGLSISLGYFLFYVVVVSKNLHTEKKNKGRTPENNYEEQLKNLRNWW